MQLVKKILKTIKEHGLIKPGDRVVLGFSGGPDSLALFHALYSLNSEYIESRGKRGLALELYPVHINHKLRAEAAEKDMIFCEEFSKKLGLECRSFVIDCNELAAKLRIGSEEAGRKARYESFGKVASEILKEMSEYMPEEEALSRIKIAVAQNADDRAETVLFRILRGTGTDGLSSIPYMRKDGQGFDIVRPIMDATRAEIEQYCEKEGLEPRRDLTNYEAVYTRNKIRLELIPYLRENFNPSITNALNRLADSAASDREYLYAQTKKAYSESKHSGGARKPEFSNCKKSFGEVASEEFSFGEILSDEVSFEDIYLDEVRLDTEKLKNFDKSIRFRVYNMALYDVGMRENVTTKFLEAIDAIRLSRNHPRAYTELTGGYRVAKEKKILVFYRNSEDDEI